MRIKLSYIAPLLAAGAGAVAIAAAPIAAAAPAGPAVEQSCTAGASGSTCESPGNVEINDSPPPVNFYPYGGDAFLLGDGGGWRLHGGGFHGGGRRPPVATSDRERGRPPRRDLVSVLGLASW